MIWTKQIKYGSDWLQKMIRKEPFASGIPSAHTSSSECGLRSWPKSRNLAEPAGDTMHSVAEKKEVLDTPRIATWVCLCLCIYHIHPITMYMCIYIYVLCIWIYLFNPVQTIRKWRLYTQVRIQGRSISMWCHQKNKTRPFVAFLKWGYPQNGWFLLGKSH